MTTSTTIRLRGFDLHLETSGQGEPLLLLHGMGGCSGDFAHAGRDALEQRYRLLMPDARGHGRSTRPDGVFSQRACAEDVLALLDELGIARCKAIGVSMGGNTLLHLATLAPERVEAMVLVSATPYYPAQARALMRLVPIESQPEAEWQQMRARHAHGDEQVVALWRLMRAQADSVDDMAFTPPQLGRIEARTLIVQGDRDPLYPIELSVEMYRAMPRASLWVVPGGGHSPVFAGAASDFTRQALAFLSA